MKNLRLGLLGVITVAIAQVAFAQNGGQPSQAGVQNGTPQPSVSNNATPVAPKQARQQNQRRQQQQQPVRVQQNQQLGIQQQQLAVVQPQVLQQTAAVMQQQQQLDPQSVAVRKRQQQKNNQQLKALRLQRSKAVPASVMSYSTALQKCKHEHHPHVWWTEHFAVIVYAVGGYYYYDAGYWFPAWGYNSDYESYDYDGPIYTYGNLLPDQVILNVQKALADLGYYGGALTGSLSAPTREAISAYQQDNDLTVNGVVDAPLVYSLGLQ